MKRCPDAVPLLGPLLDGALPPDDSEWALEHLRECARRREHPADRRGRVRQPRRRGPAPARPDARHLAFRGSSVRVAFVALLLLAQADAGWVEPLQTSRAPGPNEQRVRITIRAIAASN